MRLFIRHLSYLSTNQLSCAVSGHYSCICLFFHLCLCSVCAGGVSDAHLIGARISFGVEQSHWPMKELFSLLSRNSAPPLMRPLGFNLALT